MSCRRVLVIVLALAAFSAMGMGVASAGAAVKQPLAKTSGSPCLGDRSHGRSMIAPCMSCRR